MKPEPHKHAEVIKAWADGHAIQYRFMNEGPWEDIQEPTWIPEDGYRVKPTETRIELEDGKYTVIHEEGENFHALHYGGRWRDLTGDNLVMALVNEVEELRGNLNSLGHLNWRTEMKIYVGTYAKYNNGNLFGEWLDLEDYADLDDFYAACYELHKDEEDPELMFQDSDGLPDFLYSESAPLHEDIYEFVELDEDVREIVAEYIDNVGLNDLSAQIEEAQEAYMGNYDSMEDFAREYENEMGELGRMEGYIDWQAVARDLEHDYFITESGHVFRNV